MADPVGRSLTDGNRHALMGGGAGGSPNNLFGDDCGHLDEWAADWSHVSGGASVAVGASGGNRIHTARISPANAEGPRVSIRARREKINRGTNIDQ